VYSGASVIGNRPKVTSLYWELQYEGMICTFERSAWCITRWREGVLRIV
jgi:hypothetical protein